MVANRYKQLYNRFQEMRIKPQIKTPKYIMKGFKMNNTNQNSKMSLAKEKVAQVWAADYKSEGKSPRADFIKYATEVLGLNINVASQYYFNICRKATGELAKRINAGKQKRTNRNAYHVKPTGEALGPVAPQHRWLIVDKNKAEVTSFASRQAARDYARDNNYIYKDRNAQA